jgi:hypothetical protein
MYLQKVKSKKIEKKTVIWWCLEATEEKIRIRILIRIRRRIGMVIKEYESADPNPFQNVTVPEHCLYPPSTT